MGYLDKWLISELQKTVQDKPGTCCYTGKQRSAQGMMGLGACPEETETSLTWLPLARLGTISVSQQIMIVQWIMTLNKMILY